jgi:nitroreductase
MDTRLSSLFARRSVRDYTGEAVSEADLKALLEAGMAAPSASNRKPWHFVAATERAQLERLAAIHPYGKMLSSAGFCIAVCGDRDISPDFWVQDCSVATENILVAAAMLGLGAVWLGVHPRAERERELKQFLGIPESVGLLCLIAVGHPTQQPPARTQYDDGRVHRGRW